MAHQYGFSTAILVLGNTRATGSNAIKRDAVMMSWNEWRLLQDLVALVVANVEDEAHKQCVTVHLTPTKIFNLRNSRLRNTSIDKVLWQSHGRTNSGISISFLGVTLTSPKHEVADQNASEES